MHPGIVTDEATKGNSHIHGSLNHGQSDSPSVQAIQPLYTTPMDTYTPALPAPTKLVGSQAAHEAATNPDYKVESTLPREQSLHGKIGVVTGGASGLGLEYSLTLCEMGATVYALDIKETPDEEFEEGKAYLKRMTGAGSLEYRQADVANEEIMESLMSEIAEKHNGVHVCIANAGILGPVSDCYKYEKNSFERVMNVNVTGVFLTMRAASRVMLERNIGGSIIATASMSGSIINKDMHWVAYTASKAAVIQLCKGFACELGRSGIRVNSISPGHIRTRMTDVHLKGDPQVENNWANQNPMGRLGGVHELRGAVHYLASDMSTYTTGLDLQVCGGHTSW